MSGSRKSDESGDNAKVWTGIRDIPIWAGESSSGNRLPGGPYRVPELVAIGAVMIPALFWVTSHQESPAALWVLFGAPTVTGVLVAVLRMIIPAARPGAWVRVGFMIATVSSWSGRSVTTAIRGPGRRHG